MFNSSRTRLIVAGSAATDKNLQDLKRENSWATEHSRLPEETLSLESTGVS